MNVIKDKLSIISMSVVHSLYKSMLKTTGIRNVRGLNNINKNRLYLHQYVYENEMYKVVGPYEDRVKNLMSFVKFRIKYGERENIDDLFEIHKVLPEFMKMNKNEKLGKYKYETRVQILDNY